MAVFSGKIIEAYDANSDNDCVEVIYKQDDKAINHYLKVDFNNQDFKDLIEEYDTDKIAASTIARNRQYAKQLSDMIDQGIKSKTDVKQRVSIEEFIDSMLNFNSSDKQSAETLFALKVKIFEQDKVKSCNDKDLKSSLRSAKTPVDLISIFKKING